MQTIELEDRIIYRAAKGKKVKFTDDADSKYSEISIRKDEIKDKKVVEVDN